MVKIASYEVVLWETENFDYWEIIDYIKKNPFFINMCFLFHNNNRIMGAVRASDLILQKEINFMSMHISFDLFKNAHDFYFENEKLRHTLIPVTDSDGNYIFMLEFAYLERQHFEMRLKKYDLIKEKENLDYSFLNQFEAFVFTGLEEYSFEITRLILNAFPEKRIIYFDENIRFFYDSKQVELIKAFYDLPKEIENSKIVVIKPTLISGKPLFMSEHGSFNVLNTLLWCSNRKEYGELNNDKTVLLYEADIGKMGLVDIVKNAYAFYLIARERGWEIAVNLNKFPNQYLESEKDNMWEYYFEPLSSISVEEAHRSKNVVVVQDEFGYNVACNILFQRYDKLYKKDECSQKPIQFNKKCLDIIKKKMPEVFLNEPRVLGVIARGTDLKPSNLKKQKDTYRLTASNEADIEIIIKRVKYLKEAYLCDYVFVATEDINYFNRFKEEFSEDELLYVEQDRYSTDEENERMILADKILKTGNAKKLGYDYLAVLNCLSKCNVLTSSAWCGAYHFAQYLENRGGMSLLK